MPFLIHDISKCEPTLDKTYMFDANVWVYILEANYNDKSQYKVYHDFFEKLIFLIDNFNAKKLKAELKKKLPGQYDEARLPKIVLTPLLMSEIFKVLLGLRFKEWKEVNGKPNADFKKDFRGGPEYIGAVKHLRSELFAYEQYFTIEDDSDSVIGLKHLCENWNYDMDFHDQCYYYTCLEKHYTLVTNDGDFTMQSLEIYTALPKLLNITDIK